MIGCGIEILATGGSEGISGEKGYGSTFPPSAQFGDESQHHRHRRHRWTLCGDIHAVLVASWRFPQRTVSSRGNPAEMKNQKAMQELAEGADLRCGGRQTVQCFFVRFQHGGLDQVARGGRSRPLDRLGSSPRRRRSFNSKAKTWRGFRTCASNRRTKPRRNSV